MRYNGLSSSNSNLLPINSLKQYFLEDDRVTHMDLELEVDFQTETLSGCVVLSVEKIKTEESTLVSSTKSMHFSLKFPFILLWG